MYRTVVSLVTNPEKVIVNQKDLLNQSIDNHIRVNKFIQQKTEFWRGSRRRALQLLATAAGVTTATLLPTFHQKILAMTTETKTQAMNKQANQQLQPNLFELRGYNTQITYSTTSISGVPQLSYSSQEQERTFSSEEIQSEQTAFGQSITVFLTTGAADEPIESITLLLPAIQLNSKVKELQIQTLLLLSIRAAFVNPDAPLQLQNYDTISLSGTAKFVEF